MIQYQIKTTQNNIKLVFYVKTITPLNMVEMTKRNDDIASILK